MNKKFFWKIFLIIFIITTFADMLLNTAIPLSVGDILYSILTGLLITLGCMLFILIANFLYKKLATK